MARGRMINKKISNSRVVNELPESAQLLYTWLIPHLDCNGCFYGSAQMIKSLVVPRKNYSKTKIENWLKLMETSYGTETSPLIVRYFVNGEQYLFMPGFKGEQIGLRYDKEKPDFPTFDGNNTEEIGQKLPLSRREVEEETKEESVIGKLIINKESVLEVYQKEIGEPSEDMENEIDLACQRFTPEWVRDAIREAVKRGRKDWYYVAGILKNWKRYGKDSGEHRRSIKKIDPDKYIKGKYGHMVKR